MGDYISLIIHPVGPELNYKLYRSITRKAKIVIPENLYFIVAHKLAIIILFYLRQGVYMYIIPKDIRKNMIN